MSTMTHGALAACTAILASLQQGSPPHGWPIGKPPRALGHGLWDAAAVGKLMRSA